jgi:hypothetical protein
MVGRMDDRCGCGRLRRPTTAAEAATAQVRAGFNPGVLPYQEVVAGVHGLPSRALVMP